MNEQEIINKLESIDHQIRFLAEAYKHIHNIFIKGVYVNFEKSLLEPNLGKLNHQMNEFSVLIQELREHVKKDSILATIAYMSKRIHMMEITMAELKEKGVKKNIHLDFTVDGYEMVRKKPVSMDIVPEQEFSPEDAVKKALETLSERESMVLTHRYGLFGNKELTLKATGKIMNVTPERIREIEAKALRKLRHPERRKYVELITHKQLKKDLIGED